MQEDDSKPKLAENQFKYWAVFRQDRLWRKVFQAALKTIPMTRPEIERLNSLSSRGWKLESLARKKESIRTLMYRDDESMELQAWLAPVDICYQFMDALRPLRWHFGFPGDNDGMEDKVPKTIQEHIDKYFGLYIQHCLLGRDGIQSNPLTETAREYFKTVQEKAWKSPEFEKLAGEVRNLAETRHFTLENRQKKRRRREIIAEISSEYCKLGLLKEKLASAYDLRDEFEDESDTFWKELRAKHPEVGNDSDFTETAESEGSDSSESSFRTSAADIPGLLQLRRKKRFNRFKRKRVVKK